MGIYISKEDNIFTKQMIVRLCRHHPYHVVFIDRRPPSCSEAQCELHQRSPASTIIEVIYFCIPIFVKYVYGFDDGRHQPIAVGLTEKAQHEGMIANCTYTVGQVPFDSKVW